MNEALQTLCIPYHTNLNYREVTHLIVRRVGTDKHRLALQKGLFCVSIDWVFACRDEGKLQEPGTFKVPVFSGLVVSVTQISPHERERLQPLIEAHGGSFIRNMPNPYLKEEDGGSLEKCASHLIALKGGGEKFDCAIAWKIHVCNQTGSMLASRVKHGYRKNYLGKPCTEQFLICPFGPELNTLIRKSRQPMSEKGEGQKQPRQGRSG